MIDSHCHLNASYNATTVELVLQRFLALSGTQVVDVTTSIEELIISQQIIEQFPKIVYGNIGIHPESPDGEKLKFEELLKNTKSLTERLPLLHNIVGIGETGLDYSHFQEHGDKMKVVIEQQREIFNEHLQIAKDHNLPITIHARGELYTDYKAYEEILTILKVENFPNRVYFHSFGGDYSLAKRMVSLGYYLGVNGIATYSGAKEIAEVVEKTPLEQLLLETDSPFLIPSNMDRSQLGNPKINEPIGIFSTAKRIATLRKCPEKEVLEVTASAARKLFARIL